MKRINKRQARRLYDEGKTIYLLACNCMIGPMWGQGISVKKENDPERTFDQHVNEFESYNCNYERGYYSHYYMEDTKKLNYMT